jgi:hypothetical protein
MQAPLITGRSWVRGLARIRWQTQCRSGETDLSPDSSNWDVSGPVLRLCRASPMQSRD